MIFPLRCEHLLNVLEDITMGSGRLTDNTYHHANNSWFSSTYNLDWAVCMKLCVGTDSVLWVIGVGLWNTNSTGQSLLGSYHRGNATRAQLIEVYVFFGYLCQIPGRQNASLLFQYGTKIRFCHLCILVSLIINKQKNICNKCIFSKFSIFQNLKWKHATSATSMTFSCV